MGNVGKTGVNYLSAFISGSLYLDPVFQTDDTIISWDGNIYVFKSEKREKGYYAGTIPVQIKSTNVEQFDEDFVSHEFEVTDLNNYLKNGGILLFVVEINNQNYRFFYSMLLPFDLKKILTQKGGAKTRYIKLNHLKNNNTNQIEHICREFIFHSRKQINIIDFSLPINECKEINVPIISDDTPISDELFTHDFYAYGRRQSDTIEYVLDKVRIEEIGRVLERPIYIGLKQYYPKYAHKKNKDGEKISFGKGVEFNLTQAQISYDLQGSISEQITDCEFLIDFIDKKTIHIGKNKEDFFSLNNFPNIDDFLSKIIKIHTYLMEIKGLLELFHIEPNKLDIYKGSVSKLDATSIANLDFLIKSFIKHEKITYIPEKMGFYYLQVSNLNIGVFVYRKESEDFIRALNLFESLDDVPVSISTDDGKMTRISPYVLITSNNLLILSNLNLDFLVSDIKKYTPTDYSFTYINQFGLELISSYDKSSRIEFLNSSLLIFQWLSEFTFFKEISKINEFQTYKRLRQLTKDEIDQLFELRELNTEDNRLLCGIDILLEHKHDAKLHFSKLNPIFQEEFKKYPIFSLGQMLHFFD